MADNLIPLPTTAPAPVRVPPQKVAYMTPNTAQALNAVPETDTQPLWFRLVLPGATVIGANARTYIFNKQKNTDPDLTNLEVAGQMPNTSEYKVAAIEIRPNGSCTSAALNAFLNHHVLKIEVGAKNFEKVNQPAVMFASLANIAGLNNNASVQQGLYRFNNGEELYLQASQTFNVYFLADRAGATLGTTSDLLDCIVVLHGQKAAKVAL
jgi:hypothetical protein